MGLHFVRGCTTLDLHVHFTWPVAVVVERRTETRLASTTESASVSASSSLLPGRRLLGRYGLEEVLGCGGTSLVIRAFDLSWNNFPVALKVFNLPGNDAQRIARFRQAFRRAAEMRHPNIMHLLELYTVDAVGSLPGLLMLWAATN